MWSTPSRHFHVCIHSTGDFLSNQSSRVKRRGERGGGCSETCLPITFNNTANFYLHKSINPQMTCKSRQKWNYLTLRASARHRNRKRRNRLAQWRPLCVSYTERDSVPWLIVVYHNHPSSCLPLSLSFNFPLTPVRSSRLETRFPGRPLLFLLIKRLLLLPE